MIKIRYRDPNELSPGLHAAAERHGRSTTVYLLSGLTLQERRAALRRLRLSSRMGHCPRLPAAQLALALLADRIRTTIRQAGAVFRVHPAGSTVPVMVISAGAITFLVLSTVSIRVLPAPRTASQSSASGPLPVASADAVPISGSLPDQAGGALGSPGGPGGPGGQGNPGGPVSAGQPGSGGGQAVQGQPGSGGSSLAPSPGPAGPGTGGIQHSGAGPGSGTAGGTTLSGGANPAPTSPPAAASPAPAPSTATGSPPPAVPKPTASATARPGGVCVNVGPLGICLNV